MHALQRTKMAITLSPHPVAIQRKHYSPPHRCNSDLRSHFAGPVMNSTTPWPILPFFAACPVLTRLQSPYQKQKQNQSRRHPNARWKPLNNTTPPLRNTPSISPLPRVRAFVSATITRLLFRKSRPRQQKLLQLQQWSRPESLSRLLARKK